MKKFAKMSLVAAVAVAGMTSTVSAKDLSEAIKGVDISGTVVYRYDDRKSDAVGTSDVGGINAGSNSYKAIVNLKSPINDDMALNVSVVAGAADGGLYTMDTTDKTTNPNGNADGNVGFSLSKVNFVYTGISHTTAIVGKQGLTTPWTVASDADGNEQTGTGALALVNAGPATIAGGYFNQTNLDKSGDNKTTTAGLGLTGATDLYTVAVMANVGPVALDAWYLDAADVFDTYTLGAAYSTKFSGASLKAFARYSSLSPDKQDIAKDQGFWKIGVSGKMGIFGAMLGYGQTDKDGGLVALDNDATTGFQGWTVQPNGVADADIIKANVSVQAMKALNIALNYNDVDASVNKNDVSEIYLQGTWTPSKNFYTYVRFGQNTETNDAGKDIDSTIGRLQVQYSF